MSNDRDAKVEGEEAAPVWPRVVKLRHPFDFGKEHIAELEFRRGKLGHLNGIKLRDGEIAADDLITVASRMCGKQREVIERLDPEDGSEVLDIAMDFFLKCLGAGKTK